MTTRRFAPLFCCQFFAAFGDNFLKTALVFVILFEVAGPNSGVLITLAGATLIAPFFLLSGLGGELADRYDKAWVAQRIKLTEIGAAGVAVAGFGFHSLSLLFLAVFMFGTLAALFGPIKYGILPDLLERRELPSGNALIEGGTFLAILLGTIVAGIAANGNSNPIHFAWLMILTALASCRPKRAPPISRSTAISSPPPLRLSNKSAPTRGCGGAASWRAGSGSSARWCCRCCRRWCRMTSAAAKR
jgi:acyl-[acyl-carrier-protein]-phospholipid O-acyltransferase/long-chain-fatty-acid--[acyl-carrier-protein] ligase